MSNSASFIVGNAITTALLSTVFGKLTGVSNSQIADILESSSDELLKLWDKKTDSPDGFNVEAIRHSIDLHASLIRMLDTAKLDSVAEKDDSNG